MSQKRPSDNYTRFTANGPHASQKPAPSFASSPTSNTSAAPAQTARYGPTPVGETPQQKVDRLRKQARTQKELGALSPVDRFLVKGRRWADFTHRATTYGLFGLAGLSAAVALYGLVGLVSHSRRQKRAWIEREMGRLDAAQQAFLRGEADAEQLHLLEQERAGEEMVDQQKREKDKKKSEGIWSKVKAFAGTGAVAGDMGAETAEEAKVREMMSRGRERVLQGSFVDGEVRPAAVEKTNIEGVGLDSKGRPVPLTKMERVVRRAEPERNVEVINRAPRAPGPLDVMAGNISEAVAPSHSVWLSWIRGSSS